MVEHQNHNLLVEGSSPPLATNKKPQRALGFSVWLDAALETL